MHLINPFHLAIPVHNLNECRIFYRDILGCVEGRSSDQWVDFNFFGHQLVIHYKPKSVLPWDTFHEFATQLKSKNIQFIIEPYIRFEGKIGEQATMFFYDLAGNALEFKAFKDMDQLFAK
jgi:extradiol dioxygenase family protein